MDNNLNTTLVEDTTTPAEPNVATVDQNLSVNAMFQQSSLPSLGRQIFSVIPIFGPTAALFNIRRKAATNDFELLRKEVAVFPSQSIKTGLTLEVIQDIKSQFGKEANNVIGRLLRGLANEQENTRTIAFLEAECKTETDLHLSDGKNIETNLFEITQRVNELVMHANMYTLRTYEAFCVLPHFAGAAVSGLRAYVGGEDKEEQGLFLTKIGQIKYYLNPVANSIRAYVGLRDSQNPSKSSAVFSPYESAIVDAIDPDSGESTYHIFNRFAITASPLHELNNEMLFKFDITKAP